MAVRSKIQVEAWSPLMQGKIFAIKEITKLIKKYVKTAMQLIYSPIAEIIILGNKDFGFAGDFIAFSVSMINSAPTTSYFGSAKR